MKPATALQMALTAIALTVFGYCVAMADPLRRATPQESEDGLVASREEFLGDNFRVYHVPDQARAVDCWVALGRSVHPSISCLRRAGKP